MLDLLLVIHNLFRWIVMLAAVLALVVTGMSARGGRRWDVLSDRSTLIFTITMDVQWLIGILLWLSEQRWTIPDLNLTWLHPVLMTAAVALAHIGRSRSDRDASSEQKGRAAVTFFIASLALIIVAVPLYSWFRVPTR